MLTEATIDDVGKATATIFNKPGHHRSSKNMGTVSLRAVCCWDLTALSFVPTRLEISHRQYATSVYFDNLRAVL